MKLYQLNIPTKVLYGRNIWKEAIEELEFLRHKNIMIVTTGRSLTRAGYVSELEETIQSVSYTGRIVVFDTISANPRLTEIKEAISFGKKEKIQAVIGFGGGSSIDAAKAIAVGIGEKEDIGEFFYNDKEPGRDTLPIVSMPTTAGTGSELSKAAIITDEEKKLKKGIRGVMIYPKVAIVDSVFTESIPYRVTMETGFDVLAHAIESYMSNAASPYTQMLSESAIRTVGLHLPRLSIDLNDSVARAEMSFASMIMGINLGNASTCLPHRLQYPLGGHTDTSHGAGLAALFTSWINMEYNYAPHKIERVMSLLAEKNIKGRAECVEIIGGFIESLGLPVSLEELGIDKKLLSILSSEVGGNIQNDPIAQNKDIILNLYRAAWSGKM